MKVKYNHRLAFKQDNEAFLLSCKETLLYVTKTIGFFKIHVAQKLSLIYIKQI